MAYQSSQLVALATLCAVSASYGFELTTHQRLSEAAVGESVLVKSPSVLKDVGLSSPDEPLLLLQGEPRSIRQIVGVGGRREDTLTTSRPINHFFDPTRAGDSNNGAARGAVSVLNPFSSPTWALADRGPVNGQENSFRNARSYLLNALTLGSKVERESNFTKTFQTLGMVIHHLQDMAQPQHVRNDLHCPDDICKPFFHNPSAYERYTEDKFTLTAPAISGYPSVYTSANTSILNTPRKLWYTGDGKGIAEFTNRNFVSDRTNFRYDNLGTVLPDGSYGFPLPLPATGVPISIDDAYKTRKLNPLPAGAPQEIQSFCASSSTCVIEFYATSVVDSLTGPTVINPRASSLSIFDHNLQLKIVGIPTSDGEKTYSTSRLFSLNSFNFDTANDLLLKRAVGYSAGLIDYFFRGKLEVEGQGDNQILVKNATKEAMKGDFGLYYDDTQDNRYPVTITACSVGSVDVPVVDGRCKGAELAAANPAPGTPLQVTFMQPTSPSPKSADAFMLVFTGDLGEEKASANNIGAVVGKSLTAPYNNALYVVGLDANGQRIVLRADKSGTVEVPADVFQPYKDVSLLALSSAPFARQVKFTKGPFGYSYETLAVTVGNYYSSNFPTFVRATPQSWIKDAAMGAFKRSSGSISWIAQSPDPQIGEFLFFPNIPVNRSNPTTSLIYSRTFKDAAGNTQTTGGTLPLPATPGNSYVPYFGFISPGAAFISDDGLTLGPFQVPLDNKTTTNTVDAYTTSTTTKNSTEEYVLKITLGETPTLQLIKRGENSYQFTKLSTQRVRGYINSGVFTVQPPCDPNPISENIYKQDDLVQEQEETSEPPTYLGYRNGSLASVRGTRSLLSVDSVQSTSMSAAGSFNCNWIYGKLSTRGVSKTEITDTFYYGNGKTVVNTVKRDYTARYLAGGLGLINFLHNQSVEYFYEGAQPGPPPVPVPIVQPNEGQVTGYGMLTDDLKDAVIEYSDYLNGSASRTKFRDIDITGKTLIGEGSPTGEVFLSDANLSFVVHEPKRGPKIVIPPRMIRLLAAVWM